MKRFNLLFKPPNYLFHDVFDERSTVVDVGCGHEAEFSVGVVEEYGASAYGVDPTRKHAPWLRRLEERFPGRFQHLDFAVTATDGSITFHESRTNESGSILDDHRNMVNDETESYEVESVSLRSLADRIPESELSFLKLDLEGAEFDLLEKTAVGDLDVFGQIFVEFHHDTIPRYSFQDTRRVVRRIAGAGWRCYSLDDRNYLFLK